MEGPLWKKIILFALPLAVTGFLQQLFSSADIAALGRGVSAEAMAAVGATVPMVNLNLNMFIGLSVGATVVIAHLLGEGRNERVEGAVHSGMLLSVLAGILVCGVDYVIAEPVLRWMDTSEPLLGLALEYLYVYFLSVPFLMVFNFGAAVLRAKGETKRPLFCLAVACFSNIGLNALCVQSLGWGVQGIAAATVVSNALSTALLLLFMLRDPSEVGIRPRLLRLERATTEKILRIGLPAALQGMVYSFSNIIIQSAINSLGHAAIAASAIALNYEMWGFFLLNSFGQACVAFNGLCYGAREFERCREVTRCCLWLNLLVTNGILFTVLIFPDYFISFFTADRSLYALTTLRLFIVLGPEGINICSETFASAMRGWGYSLVPALISIFGICVVRVIYVYTVFAARPDFGVLMSVYPLTWVVTASSLFAAYHYVRKNFLAVRK